MDIAAHAAVLRDDGVGRPPQPAPHGHAFDAVFPAEGQPLAEGLLGAVEALGVERIDVMREMPEMIDHTEHQRAIDLNDHTLKEIREPQLVRVVQHGGELRGHDLGVRKFGVGDDTDIRILLHQEQQVAEAHGRVPFQKGRGEKRIARGNRQLADPLLPAAAPVVPQDDLPVARHAQIDLEYPRPARVVAIEAFAAVEHGGPAQLAESVHDGAGGGQDLLRAQLARGPGLLFGDRRSGRGCQHGKAGKAYQKQRQRTQQRRADADMDKIADDGSPLKTGKKPPYITP